MAHDEDLAVRADQSVIELEQGRVDAVHVAVEDELACIEHKLASLSSVNKAEQAAMARQLRAKKAELEATDPPLCFARFDLDAEGGDVETFYLGRRSVGARADDLVTVVNWRAPMAQRYYQATAEDRQGLLLRRSFDLADDQRTILQLADDRLGREASAGEPVGPTFEDLLLAELATERTGHLADVVATIQAEQDRVIRLPHDGPVVVQGGPGTGKTVVGLHRLSYLLYAHADRLRAGDVLVVGPNAVFLQYAGQVLPSLGDGGVRLATPSELALGALTRTARDRVKVARSDEGAVARLKGDARLAEVVRRAVLSALRPGEAALRVQHRGVSVELAAADLAAEVARALRAGTPLQEVRRQLMDGRRQLETGWVEDRLWAAYLEKLPAWDRVFKGEQGRREFVAALKADRRLAARLDEAAPPVDAVALVRRLLTDAAYLAECSAGLLDEAERELLHRRPPRKGRRFVWSEADLPLIDEAAALVRGVEATFEHVVVDEAQDLSAMQARVVARRTRGGSLTVLGDVAQGTGAAATPTWAALMAHLAPGAEPRYESLGVTYRVPAAVLDFARPVGEAAAPGTPVPESVRPGGEVLVGERRDDLGVALAEAVSGAGDDGGLVGVVVARSTLAVARAALAEAGVAFAEAPAPMAGSSVYLVPAELAKGLEFDEAIVVEPRAIVEEGDQGHASLFVALTRPTKRLVVVRARELPEVLGGPPVEATSAPEEEPSGQVEAGESGMVAALRAENARLMGELAALQHQRAKARAHLVEVVAALHRLAS